MSRRVKKIVRNGLSAIRRNYTYHIIPALLLAIWCYPYFTTGQRIEWGDFSFFAQAYEAIKISLVDYKQFPWWNPWVAGGVPLYANPQIGVFSLQTLLTVALGASLGLKLTIALFTCAGYASMFLLLRRYFHVTRTVSSLLGLIWVFSSFFVAHLPAHFTFIWFLLAPAFVHLALTVRKPLSGLWLGLAFAIMALSQVHNAFFQIFMVCAIIVICRLVRYRPGRWQLVQACAVAAVSFAVLAGHRLIMVAQNVSDFPRAVVDPAQQLSTSLLAPILPYSLAHNLFFLKYPAAAPYGWGEMTASLGLCVLLVCAIIAAFMIYRRQTNRPLPGTRRTFTWGLFAAFFLLLGLGAFVSFSPYSLLKLIPVFGEMRIASRWFLWMNLGLIVAIGLAIRNQLPRRSFVRFLVLGLLCIGTAELFILNVGYQSSIFKHDVILANRNIRDYQFGQTYTFGESVSLPGGSKLPQIDPYLPHFYREYEATSFNIGVLQANDALVDQNTKLGPLCSYPSGCGYVLSGNASVVSWTPQQIILKRTAPGHIRINANESNYFTVNGVRNKHIRVAEPHSKFVIPVTDSTQTITIRVRPSMP